MLKLASKDLLSLLLCALVLNQPSIVAASTAKSSRSVLGSITSRGSVRVGEILMPSQGTLFSGDRVQTNNGGAVIQYRDGARIVLASESLANFAPARVQLEMGLMTFQTVSATGMVFAISTLRLEPATPKTSANVTFKETKASVAVTEGTLKVVDPSGVQLASLNAGDARLFEEAPTASPDPAAASPAAPPPGSSSSLHYGSKRKWLIALGVGAAGATSAGIIASAKHGSNANSGAAAESSQIAALTTQLDASQAQAAALQAQAEALGAESEQAAAIAADLEVQLAALTQAQAQLAVIQRQLAAGQLTPAAAAQQLAALQASIAQSTSAIANAGSQLGPVCAEISPTNPSCPG